MEIFVIFFLINSLINKNIIDIILLDYKKEGLFKHFSKIIKISKEVKMHFEVLEGEGKKDLLPLTPSAKEIVGDFCGTFYPEVFAKLNGSLNGSSLFITTVSGVDVSLNSLSEIIRLYEVSTK
jgi:hypothetical protein